MKKVAKNPAVLEVVNIPSVQKQLDRLADLLNKIQKALGEYLERERASFPRCVLYSLSMCMLYSLSRCMLYSLLFPSPFFFLSPLSLSKCVIL